MSLYGPCAVAPWVGITNDDIPNCKAEVSSFMYVSRQTPSTRSLRWITKDTYNVSRRRIRSVLESSVSDVFFHSCTLTLMNLGSLVLAVLGIPKWNRFMKGGMSSSGNFP